MKKHTEAQNKHLRNYSENIREKEKVMANGGYQKPSKKTVEAVRIRIAIDEINMQRELQAEMDFLL